MARRSRREKAPWLAYYKATAARPPADTLTKALSLFGSERSSKKRRFAVDLGCGGGKDTFELLRRGWKVLAVDTESEIVQWINSIVSLEYPGRLKTRSASFETIKLPKCDLVNASYSLPFTLPKHFRSLWRKIGASIRDGGRFAGHFFGVRDEWSRDKDKTFHTAQQVKEMFRSFEIEFLREHEEDGTTASGKKKHWHVFSVVARKL
jgi:SAM-dependent methyltransferase